MVPMVQMMIWMVMIWMKVKLNLSFEGRISMTKGGKCLTCRKHMVPSGGPGSIHIGWMCAQTAQHVQGTWIDRSLAEKT